MLKKIEYLLPAALDAIDKKLANHDDYKDGIPSGYQSAIAGFGTSLLQMGLLPTLAVYCDKDHQAGIKRDLFLQILFAILLHEKSHLSEQAKKELMDNGDLNLDGLLRKVDRSKFLKKELKSQLLEAALAFKLAIRTYKLKKS